MDVSDVKRQKEEVAADERIKQQLYHEREQNLKKAQIRAHKDKIIKSGFQAIKNSGIMQAHQEIMLQLVQYNLPRKGNIYEFCANELLKYERKLKL